MKKSKITTEKTARYFTLGNASPQVKTVLFVCHGYAQLADQFLFPFEKIVNEKILVVAPEGLHRFYSRGSHDQVVASWMTKEDREDDIRDYVLYLDKVFAEEMKDVSADVKIIVLGFSQGAATVSRWAAMGKSRIDELILWCGFFPPDLSMSVISEKIKLTVVTASNDRFITATETQKQIEEMKNSAREINHVPFEGEHVMDIDVLKKLLE